LNHSYSYLTIVCSFCQPYNIFSKYADFDHRSDRSHLNPYVNCQYLNTHPENFSVWRSPNLCMKNAGHTVGDTTSG
ncbi:MAG: hypothetical protein MGF17_07410, partial [Trichodesmium sp. MAG_R04]|nr:hypothetical protein [Trichodesmium sp. MAG_R04]